MVIISQLIALVVEVLLPTNCAFSVPTSVLWSWEWVIATNSIEGATTWLVRVANYVQSVDIWAKIAMSGSTS